MILIKQQQRRRRPLMSTRSTSSSSNVSGSSRIKSFSVVVVGCILSFLLLLGTTTSFSHQQQYRLTLSPSYSSDSHSFQRRAHNLLTTTSRRRMTSSNNANNDKQQEVEKKKVLKFHEIVERDLKQVPIVSTSAVALKLFVVVPIWITLVLPLTITYQIGKSLVDKLSSSKDEGSSSSSATVDNIMVQSKDLIPRKDRKYDVVMLGATGFTGGLAVRHLAKTYGVPNGDNSTVQWAIAGRSKAKLQQVLTELAIELNLPDLAKEGSVDIIVCDTSNPTTLSVVVSNTRSVATTVGPFSLYGEPVIQYCVNYGTHYTDITGETSFVKCMKSNYQSVAKQNGACIISLCGNDCVPWDLSYNLLADEFVKRNNGKGGEQEALESVEFLNEFSSSASGGTLKTMCMGIDGRLAKPSFEDESILRRGRGSLNEHTSPMENKIALGIERNIPKPWKMMTTTTTSSSETENEDTVVTAPFVMSGVNYESIACSHALREDPTCSYKEQLVQPDFKTALDGVLGLVMFFTSLMNPITGTLIENYALPKQGTGPSMQDMQNEYFLAVTGTAIGTQGTIIQSLLYYNKDPGYLETARMVIECALCLALEEQDVSHNIIHSGTNGNIPTSTNNDDDVNNDGSTTILGGFYTPGFALRRTLLNRLVDTGCYYDSRVVQEGSSTTTSTSKSL